MNSLEDSYSHSLGKYGAVEEMLECHQNMNVMYMALYPLIMIRPNASSKGSKALCMWIFL